jgi:hypothetical protein
MSALLSGMPEIKNGTKPDLPPRLQSLIASSQPQAGDVLLDVIAEPANPSHRSATNAFVRSWNAMTPAQIRTYFQRALVFTAENRPAYPQKQEVMIGLDYSIRYGHGGWPDLKETGFKDEDFRTRTLRWLDGRALGELTYKGKAAWAGWISTDKLARGTHTVKVALEYDYSLRGENFSDRIEAEPFSFEITPANTPNHLIAPASPELDKLVLANLQFAETDDYFEASTWRRNFLKNNTNSQAWGANSTYYAHGAVHDFHAPSWRLLKPLPVDLCFEVTMKVHGTGETYQAGWIQVLKGETSGTHFTLRNEDDFIRKRIKLKTKTAQLVPVQYILRPSRARALMDPRVTQYYPRVITTKVLRFKMTRNSP